VVDLDVSGGGGGSRGGENAADNVDKLVIEDGFFGGAEIKLFPIKVRSSFLAWWLEFNKGVLIGIVNNKDGVIPSVD